MSSLWPPIDMTGRMRFSGCPDASSLVKRVCALMPRVGRSLQAGPNPSTGRTLSRPSRSWWRPVRVRVIRSDEHRWNRPGDVTPGFRGDAEGITLITVQGLRKSYGAREGSPRSRPDGSAGRRSSATKRFSPPSDPARPVAKVSPNMCREAADIRHDSPAVSSSRSSSRRRAARRRVRPGTRHPRARRSAHHRPTLNRTPQSRPPRRSCPGLPGPHVPDLQHLA